VRSSCTLFTSCPVINILVSSANIIGVAFFIMGFGKSLIYNMNKSWPRIDPCGTPHFTIIRTTLVTRLWLANHDVTLWRNECSKHVHLQCVQPSAFDDLSRLGSYAVSLGKQLQTLISTVVHLSLTLNYFDPEDEDTTSGTIF
jgi:hypothetical protein